MRKSIIEGQSMHRGEQQVADFLSELTIRYELKPTLIINNHHKKEKIICPTFSIPAFGIYLVVLNGKQKNHSEIKRKVYESNNIKVIFIETSEPEGKWKLYFLTRIIQIQRERQNQLLTSILREYPNISM
jgi:hypothetical protein